MRFAAIAPFLFAAIGLVRARDDRLLYTIPVGDTIATFTSDFQAACNTWPAAVNAGLNFVSDLVQPGDFQGKNADTEAKIVCSWADGTTITTFTTDVAASLGATPA
ncbi:hypothetical protein C8R43DRAFT_1005855 [Mycena crocata]|nr:hypothetical protein C8R43DRAFT_1005855 [Mycena crocata]